MYVCHCAVVTDRQVAEAVARGATSLAEACRATQAGTICGHCVPTVRSLICEYCPLTSDTDR